MLADAPLDNGRVEIRNTALLPALRRLRHLTSTYVYADRKLDLAQLADVPHLASIWLNHGFAGGLQHLLGHTDLDFINMRADKQHLDLSVFASLPRLTNLHISEVAADQDLTAIAHLTELTGLTMQGASVTGNTFVNLPTLTWLQISPPSPWDLDVLASLSRLETLALTGAAQPTGGIAQLADQLSHVDHLTHLYLYRCRWVTDLEPLTRLTSLQDISIDDTSVADLTPLTSLSRLKWLSIGNTNHVLDLTPLTNLPALADLYIAAPAPGIDLTPLQGKRMTIHLHGS